jgi:hypothetical protein
MNIAINVVELFSADVVSTELTFIEDVSLELVGGGAVIVNNL